MTSHRAVLDPVVVRDEPLRRDVDLVESEMLRPHVERLERLAGRQPLQPGHEHLDDEAATRLEMRGDVPEARDLLLLRP